MFEVEFAMCDNEMPLCEGKSAMRVAKSVLGEPKGPLLTDGAGEGGNVGRSPWD